MSAFERAILEALGATPISRESTPAFYQAMDGIAQKLQIETPTFHILPENLTEKFSLNVMRCAPNAGAFTRKTVVVSQPLLRLFESTDLSRPISQELIGTMAHEMHHCANITKIQLARFAPVMALPAAALTALYLYDTAHAKAQKEKNESPENMVKHIESAAHETKNSLPAASNGLLEDVLHYGKYIAVAAAAGAGGLWLAKQGSRYYEFAADKFAAEYVGKETMVNILEKIHAAAKEAIEALPASAKSQSAISRTLARTISAHPTLAERSAAILR